jgi:site-specific recombinase XerD
MNLAEAMAAYALQLEADGRSVHTRDQYRRHLRRFGDWLATRGPAADLAALGPADLSGFLVSDAARQRPDGGPKRATSLNALRSTLRTFFTYAHAAGWTTTNPARLLRRARTGTPPPRALADDDRARLLEALAGAEGEAARRDELLVRLLLGTGLRIGSAVGLDVGDVDFARSELAVRRTKGDRPETAYLSSDLVVRLRQFIGDRKDGPLFTTASGERLTTRQAARRFAAAVRTAKLSRSASPHTCRHTFATALLAKTGDLALVQAALRHRSIASTLVYARVDAGKVQAAVEA